MLPLTIFDCVPREKMMDGQRISSLTISSKDAPDASSATHNPANFEVVIPNSTKMTGVTGLCYKMVTIPRMFDTINPYNNTLTWYQRRVVEIPQPAPDTYLRTVSLTWEITRQLIIPPGQLNITEILAIVNAGHPDEVWSYDSALRTIVIQKTNPDPPIVWGVFFDPGHVDPPLQYANMTYLRAFPQGDTFDTLGIQRVADIFTRTEDKVDFDQKNPNSFDATKGSNLDNVVILPLFDRFTHNYTHWATTIYTTPRMNPPNLSGPTIINVELTAIGDSQAIRASTGLAYDVIGTFGIEGTPFGTEFTQGVKDGQFEGNGFVNPRELKSFRVRLLDRSFRVLTLPRNYPVHIVLQIRFRER